MLLSAEGDETGLRPLRLRNIAEINLRKFCEVSSALGNGELACQDQNATSGCGTPGAFSPQKFGDPTIASLQSNAWDACAEHGPSRAFI